MANELLQDHQDRQATWDLHGRTLPPWLQSCRQGPPLQLPRWSLLLFGDLLVGWDLASRGDLGALEKLVDWYQDFDLRSVHIFPEIPLSFFETCGALASSGLGVVVAQSNTT